MQELISIKKYCVITFSSTSHALKAEKIMKENEREFIITPTLREISSSCGLSLKFKPENLELFYAELMKKNIAIDEVYEVEVIGKKTFLNKRVMSSN